jgi:hypothetical protein
MKSKLTTIFGTLGSVAAGAATQTTGKVQSICTVVAVISGALFAFFAKDFNATGGTKPAV